MSSNLDFSVEIKEAEKAVLASVLYYFPEVRELVNVDAITCKQFFYKSSKRLWQSIQATRVENGRYDPIVVLDNLKKICVSKSEFDECVDYFNELPQEIHYFSINKYLRILYCGMIKNELDFLANKILRTRLKSDNFNDYVEAWKSEFNTIISQTSFSNYKDAAQAISDFDELIKNLNSQGNSNFLKTNFSALDKKIKSLTGGQLIIIASRPGVGKTTFALNLIYKNFESIKRMGIFKREPAIGIFSLEMTTSSLISKLIAIDAHVNLNEVQKVLEGFSSSAYFESQSISKSKQKIANLNLLFCDDTNITIGKIASAIKTWVRDYDLKLVIVDYLQLVNIPEEQKYDNPSQYQKIGMISRSLKILSMELNICIISLAQLNRKSEERKGSDKSPILSDLRESGSIEQDADIVMFLYEEDSSNELDNSEQFPNPDVDESNASSIILKIAKNRHGPIGRIEFKFDKEKGVYALSR